MRRSGFLMLSGMALRNLSRHRVKTVITSVAVAVSVALYILADSWLQGMNLDSRRNIVIYEMGAVKIQTNSYFSRKEDLPMHESFAGWEKIASELAKAGYRSAPRFVFSGTLYSGTGSAPVLFNGIDVEREKALLRYPDFIDAGQFPEPGKREIALGLSAAEKLRVGIPMRPDAEEYEELLSAAADDDERDFIKSLYAPLDTDGINDNERSLPDNDAPGKLEKFALKKDVTDEKLGRFWNILSSTGRMDVRIATTIDIKAIPERIDASRFTRDVLPLFYGRDRQLLLSAYIQDRLTGYYVLEEANEGARERILSIMTEADYSGAVRHVNQLIDAVVAGVINSPNPKTNANIAFMPLDSLQDETGLMLEGHITELLVRAADAKDSELPGEKESAGAVYAALAQGDCAALFRPGREGEKAFLGVFGWKEYAADYIAASAGDNISTRIMIFFLFVLSFLGIANTMLMAVLERTREIGMLKALGMADRELLFSYVFEALLIGLIGSAAGTVIGCLVNIPMVSTGIDYSAITEAMEGNIGYRIATRFRSTWNIAAIAGTFTAASVLSGLMAVLPTLRAIRMPVTESLRFE